MKKLLVFDMDGTIADLYGVDGWLEDLRNEDVAPYVVAKPMYDTAILNSVLTILRMCGWKVVVTTWLAKGASAEYDEAVAKAKVEWLNKYHFPYDEIHCVPYGTAKASCTCADGGYQILFDDNAEVRNEWHLGKTVDATHDILDALFELVDRE